MINIIILFLILFGLVMHRYLTNFWEQRMLPYPMGFLTFVKMFVVIYLINFIWIFGFVVGIIVFLLTLFQIIYGLFLWPFLLPHLISIYKNPTTPKVNPLAYGSWPYIVISLGLLTTVNFFVSDYASLTKNIVEFFGGSYIIPLLWLVGTIIVANLIRSHILSRYLKNNDGKKQQTKEAKVEEALGVLKENNTKPNVENEVESNVGNEKTGELQGIFTTIVIVLIIFLCLVIFMNKFK